MNFNIVEESAEVLEDYGRVSIAFRVESRLRLEAIGNGMEGLKLTEEKIENPYWKDYDQFETPVDWPKKRDIRIHPSFRGQGIGSRLFQSAIDCACARGCRYLKIETQNINVPACRFYAKQGCVLGAINHHAYADHPDEVQLIWYKEIG